MRSLGESNRYVFCPVASAISNSYLWCSSAARRISQISKSLSLSKNQTTPAA